MQLHEFCQCMDQSCLFKAAPLGALVMALHPGQIWRPVKGDSHNVGEAKDLLRKAREAMKAKTSPEL